MDMGKKQFDVLVKEALRAIPKRFQRRLSNVAIVVEEAPTADQLRAHDVPAGETLFGFYEGVPQIDRGDSYTFVLPDKITIFRKPLLESCVDEEELMREIRATVVHEIAHHFGISDDRLEEIGKY